MRVAMLIPSIGGGGAERLALELASGLTNSGHRTDLLLLERSCRYSLPKELKVRYLQNWDESAPTLLKGLSLPFAFRKLDRVLQEGGHDLVVSHMERCNGLLLRHPGGLPGLLVAHNFLTTSLSAKTIAKRLYGKMIYSLAAKKNLPLAFVAEAARIDALKTFALREDNTVSLPNFIDVEAVDAASRKALPEAWRAVFSGPVVLTAGRLTAQKGHWHLIRAFKKVAAALPEAKPVLLGEGELRPKLQGLAMSLGLHERVLFPGFETDIFPLLRNASVFALSSLNEGMPMILLEALASGCAIVSTDCPSGPREVLAPGTSIERTAIEVEKHAAGLLCPRFDGRWRGASIPLTDQEEKFAEAMLSVINDATLGNGLRAGAQARAEAFGCEVGVSRWRAVLEKVAKGEMING